MKYRILVDESVSQKQLYIVLKFIGKNKFNNGNIDEIGKKYPGIPDIEIIKHLMDNSTIFITSDRAMHNRMLKSNFFSYYINPKNQVNKKYLREIKIKNKSISKTTLLKSYEIKIPNFHNELLPDSAKKIKKYNTKRRRIRNYFDGIQNIDEINVTLSKIDFAKETIIGFRIRLSSKSGISALDGSEVYIKDKLTNDCFVLFDYVLVELNLLLLTQIKLNIYFDSAFINNPTEKLENKNFLKLYNLLKPDFSEINLIPISKGEKISKLREKLKSLSKNDVGNEILSRNIETFLTKFNIYEN